MPTGVYDYVWIALVAGLIAIFGCSNIDSNSDSYELPDLLCDDEASAKQYLLSFFESLGRKDAVAARNRAGSKGANFYEFVIYPEAVPEAVRYRYNVLDFSQYDLSTVGPQIEAVTKLIQQGATFSLEVFDYNYIGGGGRELDRRHTSITSARTAIRISEQISEVKEHLTATKRKS